MEGKDGYGDDGKKGLLFNNNNNNNNIIILKPHFQVSRLGQKILKQKHWTSIGNK